MTLFERGPRFPRGARRSFRIGVSSERFGVGDGDLFTVGLDQTLHLEAHYCAGDDFADGADAGGELVVGEFLIETDAGSGLDAACGGFVEEQLGDALADLAERQRLDKLGTAAQARGEDLRGRECEFRVLNAGRTNIAFSDKEEERRFLGCHGRRVIAIVEYGHLGDRCYGSFDVNDLLAAIHAGAERPNRAFGDNE